MLVSKAETRKECEEKKMYFGMSTTNLDRFRMMHSEIMEYYQCIEHDMKRIYSAMSGDDFADNMEWLSQDNWGKILNKLKHLDYSDNDPFFTKQEYEMLDEIRDRRNYWAHKCYIDFVYIHNNNERESRLERMIRQLENEKNRACKLHKTMQEIYINYFCD